VHAGAGCHAGANSSLPSIRRLLKSGVLESYWRVFSQLIFTPFQHAELIWGIVPIYFGWLLNESTSPKASFRTAIQTGFSFLWAGAHWVYQYSHPALGSRFRGQSLAAVNFLVTVLVIGFGLIALLSGMRRRFPKHASFLGHTRFANYFMIAIFPIQSNFLAWSWDRLVAIGLFAVPAWVLVELLAATLHLQKKQRRS
jgi:hypothetical protein